MLIISMWWLYFVHSGAAGEAAFHAAEEQTRLARAGLAYAHGIMVCGAIVVAVAIEIIVAHPSEAVHLPSIVIAVAGPLIFLGGQHVVPPNGWPHLFGSGSLISSACNVFTFRWNGAYRTLQSAAFSLSSVFAQRLTAHGGG